jgi:hypothetical protein
MLGPIRADEDEGERARLLVSRLRTVPADLREAMTDRPTLEEVEAAARVLDKRGRAFGWWKGKSYDEVAATDPIGKSEIDGIVEQMLMAANNARAGN